MPEDQEAQHWFVLLNNKRYGPYTLPALVKGVEKGVIDRGAGVWRPGWEQWRDASDVPELFAPELLAPEPDAVEEPVETEAKVEAPPVSSDAPEETEEKPEPKPESGRPNRSPPRPLQKFRPILSSRPKPKLAPAAIVPAIPEPAAAISEPAASVPEPTLVDRARADADSPRQPPRGPRELVAIASATGPTCSVAASQGPIR